jgi:HPr kinase/phosphorylase
MANDLSTIHASAVLVGAKAVLIRGPSGAGKSSLAWELIQAATNGRLRFARLVADDRAYIEAHMGRLLVRPAAALEGLIEIRGLGIRRLPYESVAVVESVVNLGEEGQRYPDTQTTITPIRSIKLPQLKIPAAAPPFPAVLAFLTTSAAGN